MSDADLIYNACLRAERRAEASMRELEAKGDLPSALQTHSIMCAVQLIREEIGNGLEAERR